MSCDDRPRLHPELKIPFDEWQLACHIANEGWISQDVRAKLGFSMREDGLTNEEIEDWIDTYGKPCPVTPTRKSPTTRRRPRIASRAMQAEK